MHGGLEGHRRGNRAADIDQAKVWMIDHDVDAALGAVAPVADLAALKMNEKLGAFRNSDVIGFPQTESVEGGAGIFAAVRAMAVAHVERRPAHLEFDGATITISRVSLSHKPVFIRVFPLARLFWRKRDRLGLVETAVIDRHPAIFTLSVDIDESDAELDVLE